MRRITMPWGCLNCFKNTSGAALFVPKTAFIQTGGLVSVRGVVELAATDPKCQVKFAYQVSNSVDGTLTHFSLDGIRSADGVYYGTMSNITANIDDKQLIRFGFLVWTTNVANDVLHLCQGAGYVEYTTC